MLPSSGGPPSRPSVALGEAGFSERLSARSRAGLSTASTPPGPARRPLLLLALLGVGFLPAILYAPLDWETGNRFLPLTSLLVASGAVAYPYLARRWGGLEGRTLRWLILFSLALSVLVLATGIFGGSTDEPFTTPRYAGLILAGKNPYTTSLMFTYTQCSGPTSSALVACASYTSQSYFVYLPLLPFLAIPGISYTATTMLCWVAILYLVRERPWALLVLSSPYPALLAANGYNDYPSLLLLTLAYVSLSGITGRAAEWLALGTKQFANVVVAGYYLWRRDLRNLAIALGVSVLWLLPFLWQAPVPVTCTVAFHSGPGCSGGSPLDFLTHINYWVWLLWVLAIFPAVGTALGRWARSARQKLLHN